MASVIELNELSFGYTSADVLKSISSTFSAGDFVALVGPNGAGKSTLLKIMSGLISGYRGSVRFCGKDLSTLSPRDLAKRLAFVPQDTRMVFPFTAAEIVLMGRLPHRPRSLFDGPREITAARGAMA